MEFTEVSSVTDGTGRHRRAQSKQGSPAPDAAVGSNPSAEEAELAEATELLLLISLERFLKFVNRLEVLLFEAF